MVSFRVGSVALLLCQCLQHATGASGLEPWLSLSPLASSGCEWVLLWSPSDQGSIQALRKQRDRQPPMGSDTPAHGWLWTKGRIKQDTGPSLGGLLLFFPLFSAAVLTSAKLHTWCIIGASSKKTELEIVIYRCDACMLSCAWLFATLWTVAHQASLSKEFSKQAYWSGLPFTTLGSLPVSGIELRWTCLLHCRRILYCWATWEAP